MPRVAAKNRLAAWLLIPALLLPAGAGLAAGEEEAGADQPAPEAPAPPKRPSRRQLTDEQIAQIRERAAARRQRRGGEAGASAAQGAQGQGGDLAKVMARGEEALKAEDYVSAYDALLDVAAHRQVKGAEALAEQARGRLGEMEAIAAAKLEEAKLKKFKGAYLEALEILKVLLEKFPYSRAADEGRALLAALAGEPRVAAAAALLAAEEADAAARYAEAVEKYKAIMDKFPESVEALKSKLRVEAMNKDETIAAALKEEQAKRADTFAPVWLGNARNLALNGMLPQARAEYQRVIEAFPGTEHAETAGKALAELDAAGAKPEAAPAPAKPEVPGE